MKTIKLCPECSEPIRKTHGTCSCGWQMPNPTMASNVCRCAYRSGQLRCEEQGRICTHPYADGPWFCRYHWQLTSDDDKCAESWRQAEQEKIIINKRRGKSS